MEAAQYKVRNSRCPRIPNPPKLALCNNASATLTSKPNIQSREPMFTTQALKAYILQEGK